MLRSTAMIAMILVLAAAPLLSPIAADAQLTFPFGKLDACTPGAGSPFRPDPFQRPGNETHSAADENAHADVVRLLQLERPWGMVHLQHSFAAPGFYSRPGSQTVPADWDDALTGVFAAYLDHSGTFTRATTNLELDGERREAGASGNPGARALTMEWELGRVVSSRGGSLELAAGAYRQRLLSFTPFANTVLADTLAGHPVSDPGLESSITLPDNNITVTFRHGSQRLDHAIHPSRLSMLELAWSW